MAHNIDVSQVRYRTFKASSGKPASAGGVEIEGRAGGEYGATTIDGTIIVSFFSVDSVVRLEVDPLDLERAAVLLRDLRMQIGDYRHVCAEHGYTEAYSCATCAETTAATTAQPTTDIAF